MNAEWRESGPYHPGAPSFWWMLLFIFAFFSPVITFLGFSVLQLPNIINVTKLLLTIVGVSFLAKGFSEFGCVIQFRFWCLVYIGVGLIVMGLVL